MCECGCGVGVGVGVGPPHYIAVQIRLLGRVRPDRLGKRRVVLLARPHPRIGVAVQARGERVAQRIVARVKITLKAERVRDQRLVPGEATPGRAVLHRRVPWRGLQTTRIGDNVGLQASISTL